MIALDPFTKVSRVNLAFLLGSCYGIRSIITPQLRYSYDFQPAETKIIILKWPPSQKIGGQGSIMRLVYNKAMNKWVQKSIDLAAKPGYLDKLYKIYPIQRGISRDLKAETVKKIRNATKSKNKIELIRTLLAEVDLFPIKDSYIAYLRKSPKALESNPKTAERIGGTLLEMGFEAIIENSGQPKETDRQSDRCFADSSQSLAIRCSPNPKS